MILFTENPNLRKKNVFAEWGEGEGGVGWEGGLE